jgi:hypothetical protein
MYCPRCGHQPISDAIRFCSYCGFKLGVVKASLSDDDEVRALEPSATLIVPTEPRQRDINIGVVLMFLGALFATLLAGRGFGLGREAGALVLVVLFASIVLFSRPLMKLIHNLLSWEELPAHSFSVNQRAMTFGSILMFASTIFLAISSMLMFGRMRTPEFLLGLAVAFVVLLITSKYLMRGLRYLVADEVTLDPVSLGEAIPSPALTEGQSVPVSLFTPQRVTTAEILTPASITEHTTNLLENK